MLVIVSLEFLVVSWDKGYYLVEIHQTGLFLRPLVLSTWSTSISGLVLGRLRHAEAMRTENCSFFQEDMQSSRQLDRRWCSSAECPLRRRKWWEFLMPIQGDHADTRLFSGSILRVMGSHEKCMLLEKNDSRTPNTGCVGVYVSHASANGSGFAYMDPFGLAAALLFLLMETCQIASCLCAFVSISLALLSARTDALVLGSHFAIRFEHDTPNMATTTMSAPNHTVSSRAPSLSPMRVVPCDHPHAVDALAFLETIDDIEIHDTVKRDGDVYFVVDVYLKHCTSNIPTTQVAVWASQKKPPQHHHYNSALCHAAPPDYRLEKRFADFADLRYQVWSTAQKKDACECCVHCEELMDFIVHSMSQPRLVVKLATNTKMRKKLLATFCNEFVRLVLRGKYEQITAPAPHQQSHHHSHSQCDVFRVILLLMERFFREPHEGAT